MKALHSIVILLALASAALAGVWRTEFVDTASQVNLETSIALDDEDSPHILYFDDINHEYALKYAYWNNSTWNFETIISGSLSYSDNSLTLDNEGNPHIIFNSGDDSIIYAYLSDESWHFETIASEEGMGACLSLALDSQGKPCIAYYNYTLRDLKYIFWDGGQ